MAKFIGFSIVCSGPPNFKVFRGPLGPGPVGPWVNASLVMGRPVLAIFFRGGGLNFCQILL